MHTKYCHVTMELKKTMSTSIDRPTKYVLCSGRSVDKKRRKGGLVLEVVMGGYRKRAARLGDSDQAAMSQEKANCLAKLHRGDLPGKGVGMLSSSVSSKSELQVIFYMKEEIRVLASISLKFL